MDFRFASEDQALRQEAVEFVRQEWDPQGYDLSTLIGWHDHDPEAAAQVNQFVKKLVAKGWWTMHWPVEFGGKDISVAAHLAYTEGMSYAGAPAILGGGLVGPVIMHYGQDWHKKMLLPRVAQGELNLSSRGFSEPNAGSDLANLQTRAVREGDYYVINGQKIWGTYRDEWMDILVRTDPSAPKHRGITYLLMQLKDERGNYLPGITIRPVYDALGRHRWDELFLEEVRVPAENLLGEENRGWYAAMTALSFERSDAGIGTAATLLHLVEQYTDYCRETKQAHGTSPLDSPIIRNQLANLRLELEANRMLAYRVGWMQSKGQIPQHEASMAKGWGRELAQRIYFFLSRTLGEHGNLLPGNRLPLPTEGYVNSRAYAAIGLTLAGGTTEVQKTIIAQRGLGLPR